MNAELYSCPRCAQGGFMFQGLKAHVCRGTGPGDERRRLTLPELTKAYATGKPVVQPVVRATLPLRAIYRARAHRQ